MWLVTLILPHYLEAANYPCKDSSILQENQRCSMTRASVRSLPKEHDVTVHTIWCFIRTGEQNNTWHRNDPPLRWEQRLSQERGGSRKTRGLFKDQPPRPHSLSAEEKRKEMTKVSRIRVMANHSPKTKVFMGVSASHHSMEITFPLCLWWPVCPAFRELLLSNRGTPI